MAIWYIEHVTMTLLEMSNISDSQVHVAHMGPIWVLSAPGRPHVVPLNLAIKDVIGEWDFARIELMTSYWDIIYCKSLDVVCFLIGISLIHNKYKYLVGYVEYNWNDFNVE